MIHDNLEHDHMQWHPSLHYTHLWLCCWTGHSYRSGPYYRVWSLYNQIPGGFIEHLQLVRQANIVDLLLCHLVLYYSGLKMFIPVSKACSISGLARLSSKLPRQGYVMERLKSSLRKFYGRYGDLIKHYEVSLSQMLHDILDMTIYNDTLNWSDITPICELITELDFNTDFDLITEVWRFPKNIATGAASQRRTLTPPDTWSCPIWDLHLFSCWDHSFLNLSYLRTFWVSNIPLYFYFTWSTLGTSILLVLGPVIIMWVHHRTHSVRPYFCPPVWSHAFSFSFSFLRSAIISIVS